MNRKKNAFTLIELLAIIVILAIIAVITVPIILNIIENSRKGAATDSAYGYKDSVNKTYITELSKPNQGSLKLDGKYEVQNDGTLKAADTYDFGVSGYEKLPVVVSGDKPTSGSLTYENNVLTSGTLVIGDYTVTYSNGSFTAAKTSIVSNNNQGNGGGSGSGSGGNVPTYTYYEYGIISEDLTITKASSYIFDTEDLVTGNYEEPINNNQCSSDGYAYYEGDDEYSAGCYYIVYGSCDNGDYNYETGMCEYCQNGDYNEESGKCERKGLLETQDSSNKKIYTVDDGVKKEVCGVFSDGTVCMTSSYYNNDYSSVGNYQSDFLCDYGEWAYTYPGNDSHCLTGYAKTKADEMISKGAENCYYYSKRDVSCSINDGDYTVWGSIKKNGNVYFSLSYSHYHEDAYYIDNQYSFTCEISSNGTLECKL